MAVVPDLPHNCNSWIVVDRATGKPCFETWDRSSVEVVDEQRFEVLTTLAWLQRYNKMIKEKG